MRAERQIRAKSLRMRNESGMHRADAREEEEEEEEGPKGDDRTSIDNIRRVQREVDRVEVRRRAG